MFTAAMTLLFMTTVLCVGGRITLRSVCALLYWLTQVVIAIKPYNELAAVAANKQAKSRVTFSDRDLAALA